MKPNWVRFLKFCIVGTVGVLPNYLVYSLLFRLNHYFAWGLGILAGMTSNYLLNEVWTWRQ